MPGFDPGSIGDNSSHVVGRTDVTDAHPDMTTSTTSQHPMITRSKDGISKPKKWYVLLTHKVAYPEPKTIVAALKDPGWTDAMGEEIDNFDETNTWSLVPYMPDMHVLGCIWVFRTKLHDDGTLDRLRSKLVAKGFNQEERIDYLETYNPVVRTATVRLILHMVTVMDWDIK